MKQIKKIQLLFCFAVLSLAMAFSQPVITWQKTYGGSSTDIPYDLRTTSDGGFIMAGWTTSNNGDVSGYHGGADFWIVKLDASGNIQWQKCLGGGGSEYPNSILQTADGGYIIDGTAGGNFWIVKIDATGDIQWQKSFDGGGYERSLGIQITSDGGYIAAGWAWGSYSLPDFHGYMDFLVIKIDASGNLIWQKCLGGSNLDSPYAVCQNADGTYMVTGVTLSNDGDVSGNHGSQDIWIVNLDASGNLLWQKCIGGTGNEAGRDIWQTTSGNFMITGVSSSNNGDISGNNGDHDFWAAKLDASGSIIWQDSYGGTGFDMAETIEKTLDGGYLLGGYTYSNNGDVSGNNGNEDYWVIKLDEIGKLEWQKCLGGSSQDEGYTVRLTPDGHMVASGFTTSNDGDVSGNHGGQDYWVVKLEMPDADGDGYSVDDGDCDDNDDTVYPGAEEICDNKDNDCDLLVDDADPDVTGQTIWYADSDGDGYGDIDDFTLACNQPTGYVTDNTDNCPVNWNPDQTDSDGDCVGDACDLCPGGNDNIDNNEDGFPDCAYPPDDFDDVWPEWQCKNNKVYVCHIPHNNPANAHTICVNWNALNAHIAHGDYLGPCGSANCENSFQSGQQSFMISGQVAAVTSGVQLYPNPVQEELFIRSGKEAFEYVEIYSVTGKLLRRINGLEHVDYRLDMSFLPEGVYFLHIGTKDWKILEKVIKI